MAEKDPLLSEVKWAAEQAKAAEDKAFADKLAKRLPPDAVERAAIEKARSELKLDRRALPPDTISVEHTRLIQRWMDTAIGSPMRLVPDRCSSFLQC
jgi:hypothetical protein